MANVWLLTVRQQRIDLFLRACVNLYGHITPKQFLLIYNRYGSDKLLKADLLKYANKLNRQAKNYYIYSDAIINTTVNRKTIDRIYFMQSGKKYYVPPREEFLNWVDENYMLRTPQSEKLQEMFLNRFHVSPLAVGSLLHALFRSLLIDESLQDEMDIYEKFHVFDKSTIDDVNALWDEAFIEFANHTRRWANCGFTPMEMLQF